MDGCNGRMYVLPNKSPTVMCLTKTNKNDSNTVLVPPGSIIRYGRPTNFPHTKRKGRQLKKNGHNE